VAAHLGPNRYGEDGIRLVLVTRPDGDEGTHTLRDLTVDVRLEGAFERVHTEGDNSPVLPTDTMRSTVYALAQHHLTGSIEAFGIALTERFLAASPAASLAEVTLREHSWGRAQVDGSAHPHAFVGGGAECATAVVTRTSTSGPAVRSGISGLTLLRTSGSAFSGFLRDEFTVLAETDDRIMATDASADWTYLVDHQPSYDDVRAAARVALVEVFSNHPSASVQHTLYAMGEAVIDACPDVEAVRLRMPNKHHIPVDLSAVGLTNDRAVYVATDRPFGVIEGEVSRDYPATPFVDSDTPDLRHVWCWRVHKREEECSDRVELGAGETGRLGHLGIVECAAVEAADEIARERPSRCRFVQDAT
jgi:urate oxidase